MFRSYQNIGGANIVLAADGFNSRSIFWLGLSGIGFNSSVFALTVYDKMLIAGGRFTTAGGTAADDIAAWDGTSWSPLGTGMSSEVTALTVYDNKLIAGGWFTGAGGTAANRIAVWDGTSWSALGTGMNDAVFALTVYDNMLIAGGRFATAGGTAADGIAAWDGASWSPLGSGIQGMVTALTVYDNRLIAGGLFTTAGSVAANYVAAWNGTFWSALGAGIAWLGRGLPVQTLGIYDGKLITGGTFNTAGGAAAPNIAAWDGTSWSALGSGIGVSCCNLTVFTGALTVYNSNLVTGGAFWVVGGDKVAAYLAEWTKRDVQKVALDIKPGSCPNPINGNSAHGQGKAVLPVAILGAADFDVHDIDPATITLNGAGPVRWDYHDVDTPVDDLDDECACSEAGPDGYDDLTMKFHSAEIVASLGKGNIVQVEGQLYDGSAFEGQDCVTLVGNGGAKVADAHDEEQEFELMGNSPNPFNPTTRISFYLPESAPVRLEIFNVLGQRVATLIDQTLEAGRHSVIWDGIRAASGVYYYRLKAGELVATHQMLLMK